MRNMQLCARMCSGKSFELQLCFLMETFSNFVDMKCNIDDDASIVFGWIYRYCYSASSEIFNIFQSEIMTFLVEIIFFIHMTNLDLFSRNYIFYHNPTSTPNTYDKFSILILSIEKEL